MNLRIQMKHDSRTKKIVLLAIGIRDRNQNENSLSSNSETPTHPMRKPFANGGRFQMSTSQRAYTCISSCLKPKSRININVTDAYFSNK